MNNPSRENWRYIKLGDLLVSAGAISRETLAASLEEQKISRMRIGEILINNERLTERQLADALSRQLKLPLVSLAEYKPAPEAVKIIPEAVAQRLEIVPLAILESGKIAIAMSDPLNVIAVDELRMITNAAFDINIATASDVRRALMNFYKVRESLKSAIDEFEASSEDFATSITSAGLTQDVAGVSADDAPVVRLVSNILEQAVKDRVSDVHIEVYESVSKVRFRVDGALFEYVEYPASLHPAVISRLKIIAGMDISERRKPQDGRIMVKVLDKRIDLRVNTLPTIYGEKAVMRFLDQSASKVGIANLGLFEDDVAALARNIAAPHGIFLITGPTGSGKSTTLYSLLEILNRPDVNIITVEDPVEYMVPGINQVQVNEKTGLTFAEALRSILRQDPDKIMVGEIRDYPTAELAIRAALTGHLVLSTLHTNDAPGSVVRLLDMGVAAYLISTSLVAVAAQRLLRRLCPMCRAEYLLPGNIAADYGLRPGIPVYAPVGCDNCRNTGYKGRIAIVEIMEVNDRVKDLINSGAAAPAIRRAAMENGMRVLTQSAMRNVLSGVTSVEETLALTVHNE
ncbi:MAG: Flp pilus assembly complex ATPase component TadA [Synergistaceae bacterium]|jgi:type IV pilus assembly protein PilB|nr:Flp pilus assembly complex ATPase component TadA [Synergistaceae bacterium]